MGSSFDRKTAYHDPFIHYDIDRIWTLFQAVYVHCHFTNSIIDISRWNDTECCSHFSEVLCRCMPWGNDHCSCVYHLLNFCRLSAFSRYNSKCRQYGLELYRPTDIQYADSGRYSEDEWSSCERYDGIIIYHFILKKSGRITANFQ